MVFSSHRVLLRAQSILAFLLMTHPSGAATNAVEFNRDVRPILAENCFACHGPDKNQRKAKLRLDVREAAVDREAIVPGKPEQSKLVEHILSSDPDEVMPPPKTRKTLTTQQKELLKQWIAAGAEYESHWAYIKPKTIPGAAKQNSEVGRKRDRCFCFTNPAGKENPALTGGGQTDINPPAKP